MPRDDESEIFKNLLLLDERPLAIKVEQNGKRTWIPRSQVRHLSKGAKLPQGQELRITIPEWLAIEKGLI